MEHYNEILSITNDEKLTKGVIQAVMLTGCDYKHILRSMGFKID